MDILKKIKELFVDETNYVVETVSVHEIQNWFSLKMNNTLSELSVMLDATRNTVESCKQEIEHVLTDLDNSQLSHDNFSQREISFMTGNREAFIKATRMFIQKLCFPESIESFFDFVTEISSHTKQFARTTERQTQILGAFFGDHVKHVLIQIGEIERLIYELVQEANKHHALEIGQIHLLINNLKELLANKIQIQENIDKQKLLVKNKNEECASLHTRIDLLNNSDRIISIKTQKYNTYNYLEKSKLAIINMISPLSPILRKYL